MTAQERLAPGKYALSVDDYVMLAAAGVFADRKTELIEGDVIVLAPEYRPHAFIRDELAYRLRRALEEIGSDLHASSGSVWLSETSMPQPDIVLTREPRGQGAIPLASVALLMEVSSTTLPTDLGRKLAIYASVQIQEYWVIDVQRATIHQRWSPAGDAYAERRDIVFGEPMQAATIAGLAIDTQGL